MSTTIGNIGKKIIEVLGILIGIGIAVSYIYHSMRLANVDIPNLGMVAILLLFMLLAYGVAMVLQQKKIGMFVWVILVVAIPRVGTLLYVGEVVPKSDSIMYYEIAKAIVENGIVAIQDFGMSEYIAMFPYIVFYPFLMALGIEGIGASISHMQWFNGILNIATGILLFALVNKRTGGNQKLASIAVLLWACNPSQFLYAPLIYTEHIFLLFVIALLYIYSTCETKDTLTLKEIVLYGVAIGLCAFGAYQSRVIGAVVFIAILLYEIVSILIRKRPTVGAITNRPLTQRISMFAIALLVMYIMSQLYQTLVLKNIVLPEHKQQSGFVSYTFYVGANTAYNGTWNEPDASTALSRVREVGIAQANQEYWKKVFQERYPMDVWDYLVLQAHKFVIFHEPSHGSVGYLRDYEALDVSSMTLATYLFETVMIVLLGVKVIKKKQFTSRSCLLLLIFIGNTLVNVFVEAAARYSSVEAILLCILLVEQWNEDYIQLPKVETQETKREEVKMEPV